MMWMSVGVPVNVRLVSTACFVAPLTDEYCEGKCWMNYVHSVWEFVLGD
jgi:hypothetical protein